MTHYTCLVVTSKTDGSINVEAQVEQLLSPYDENLPTAPTPMPCDCIGWEAYKECYDKTYEILFGAPLEHSDANKLVFELGLDWDVMYEAREEIYKPLYDAHPKRDTPTPTCENCFGSGTQVTTYNQNAKWDWYEIGGRWDGELQSSDNASTNNNIMRFSETDRAFEPAAVLLPNYEWVSPGRVGWFGTSSATDESSKEFSIKYNELREQYSEHTVVLVDLHI